MYLIKNHTGTIYWGKNRTQETAVEVGQALLIEILLLL